MNMSNKSQKNQQQQHHQLDQNHKSVSDINMINLLAVFVSCLLASSALPAVNAQYSCTNPNRNTGLCRSIYECPSLLGVVQNIQLTSSQRSFLTQSQCQNGIGRAPHVCCTSDADFKTQSSGAISFGRPESRTPPPTPVTTSKPNIPSMPSNGRGNVLPQPPNCGPLSLSDKIYNGNDTALDEYPWMVLLEYTERNGQTRLSCGGSLINQRYVLTAAHCITGQIETEIGPLNRVRLGEYDTSKEIDCILDDCNQRVLEIGVEEAIPHPQFDPYNANRHHDIGLVRLSRDVTYTDFIKPVCLPLTRTRNTVQTGENLVVAGWGRTLLSRASNIKQHLSLVATDQMTCRERFSTKRINIIETQLCAGGEFERDSCDGDSGGPLMRKQSSRWYLEGIVSFGHRCGLEGWPAVYTRVTQYIDWIQQNLRP